jgi:hypothetical protein
LNQIKIGNVQPLPASAPLQGQFASLYINQDAPHGFRCRSEKMCAVLPRPVAASHQLEPCLMHQCGGL